MPPTFMTKRLVAMKSTSLTMKLRPNTDEQRRRQSPLLEVGDVVVDHSTPNRQAADHVDLTSIRVVHEVIFQPQLGLQAILVSLMSRMSIMQTRPESSMRMAQMTICTHHLLDHRSLFRLDLQCGMQMAFLLSNVHLESNIAAHKSHAGPIVGLELAWMAHAAAMMVGKVAFNHTMVLAGIVSGREVVA